MKAVNGKESEQRCELEMMILAQLRGKKDIPLILATCPLPNQGVNGRGAVLVMQLVGRNLADVERQMPTRSFSAPTLYRAMRQVLVVISYIHEIGFLHRDVKPPNCCLRSIDVSRIYLLDLGLARRYVDGSGMVRRSRKKTPFRGTVRYASLAKGDARTRIWSPSSTRLLSWVMDSCVESYTGRGENDPIEGEDDQCRTV